MAALRTALGLAAVVLGALAIYVFAAHEQRTEQMVERRSLDTRFVRLAELSLAQGSPLACLDGAAGEAVETACEKSVFARPESTAAAIAYMTARLDLLADGADFVKRIDSSYDAKLGGLRRSIELDRYGVAAHVLATRDACTSEQCAAFAFVRDPAVLKSNMRTNVFNQYVGRYAAGWEQAPAAAPATPPLAAVPEAVAPVTGQALSKPGSHPSTANIDFPSSNSIPPVSIMNAEPKLPETAPPPAPPAAALRRPQDQSLAPAPSPPQSPPPSR